MGTANRHKTKMFKTQVKKDLEKTRKAISDADRQLDWRKIWAIIEKNFIVLMRDKTRLIPLLAFPMIMIIVIGFTSGNTPKHIPAVIVPNDQSPLSGQIIQAISGSEYFSVKYMASTEGEARNLLDSGQVRVIIEIPPQLEEQITSNGQAQITVIVDESDSAVAATSRQVIKSIVDGISDQLGSSALADYQASIAKSATQLSQVIVSLPNQYAYLAAASDSSLALLDNAKTIVDAQATALIANPAPPRRVNIPANTTVTYEGKDYFIQNETGFVLDPTTANAQRAQSGMLSGAAAQIDTARQIAMNQKTAALAAAAQMTALLGQPDTGATGRIGPDGQTQKPLATIAVFTAAKDQAILHPLVYGEKPAYGTGKQTTDFLIPSLIALTIFQGAIMGMGRAVAGEKREGSLTRVFLTPTSNTTIITGTLLFYVLFEMVRASFLIGVAIVLFNLKIEGSYLLIALTLAIYITVCTGIGMIMSSLVRTEQQFMAMSMLVSLPTIFLSGVFFPVQAMPKFMQLLSVILPVTYAGDALRGIMVKGLSLASIASSIFALSIFLIVIIAGVIVFFKRDVE